MKGALTVITVLLVLLGLACASEEAERESADETATAVPTREVTPGPTQEATPLPTEPPTPDPTSPPTRVPTPKPTVAPPPVQQQSCHPSYTGACLNPNASDYDCAGGSGDGPYYTGPVGVVGPDVFDLDRDGDGLGCE